MDIPTLETERLILRAFRDSDIEAYAAMNAHPDVARFINVEGKPKNRMDSWRSMAMNLGHWELRGFGQWAAEEKSTGAFVGRLGLYYPEGWIGREVGYALAHEHWGKGYATEGAKAARDYAFETLNWDEVLSVINPANTASLAVAERLGETFREVWVAYGITNHVYGLTRADWEKLER